MWVSASQSRIDRRLGAAMIRKVMGAAVRYRLIVLLTALCAVAVGVVVAPDLPRDVLPEFSPTTVEVQTEAAGLSAAEVEQLLTVPLEADLLNGVPWLTTLRSESVPGLSSITLVFEPGTDPLRARQMVNERVTQAKALPNVSAPPIMLEPQSSTSRVLAVSLAPTTMSQVDASVLARYTIRPRLMSVPGVANVVMWGQQDRQLQVAVDPRRLAAADVTVDQVVQSAGNAMWVSPLSYLEASSPGSGGFIDTTNQRLGIQHVSPIVSPDTLGQVTLEDTPNRVVKLSDVATITADHAPLIGDAAAGGQGGLLLVVEKFPGADTLAVTDGVEAALSDLRPGLGGMRVSTSAYRPASYIEQAVSRLALWLALAGLLALLGVGLLVRSWRAVLVSAISVVVAVAVSTLALWAVGMGANAVVLAGLVAAVGVVIDDAVVDVWHRRRRARSTGVGAGPLEARVVGLYALVVGALAVAAVFTMAEPGRSLYSPLAVAFLLAVAASMLVALTVTPAMSALLLGRDRARPPHLPRRAMGWHRSALTAALTEPHRALIASAVLVVAAVAVVPVAISVGAARPMPPLNDPNLVVQLTGADGTSLPEMTRVEGLVAAQLRAIPGVHDVVVQTGRAVFGDQVVNVNSGQLWVGLDPGADHDATLAKVHAAVRLPGVDAQVLTYEQQRTDGILGPTPRDITVRVFGQDPDVLAAKSAEVARMLGGVDGVVDVTVHQPPTQPTVVVEPDLGATQRFGIKPGDVRRAATELLSGIVVGSLYQDQKIFDVVVRGTPDTQHSFTSVQDLLIDTPSGGHIRLGDVATVRIVPRPSVIQRDQVSRVIDVTADVRGRTVGAASAEAAQKLAAIPFPLEHHAEVLGNAAQSHADTLRTVAVAAAALLVAFLLLQLATGSWALAAAVTLGLPVALSGCVLAAASTGELSLGALAGMLAVLTVAVRLTLRYTRSAQRLRARGVPFGPALVRRAAREELYPAVTTTLLISAVLLPAVLMGPTAGMEFLHPLAVSVLGGLVTTLFLALFVLPAVYLRAAGRRAGQAFETTGLPGHGEQPVEPHTRDREVAPV
jgi:Cu/Ag efflux pump CusA